MPAVGKLKAVKSSVVPGTLTRMDLFDKLGDAEPSILRGTSSIMKCMEEIVDGFTVSPWARPDVQRRHAHWICHSGSLLRPGCTQVSDTLREMLVKGDESENCELYSEQDKAEFLFRVFKALCLGGSMNQYEVCGGWRTAGAERVEHTQASSEFVF